MMTMIKKTIEHSITCTASAFRQRLTMKIKSSKSEKKESKEATVGGNESLDQQDT